MPQVKTSEVISILRCSWATDGIVYSTTAKLDHLFYFAGIFQPIIFADMAVY